MKAIILLVRVAVVAALVAIIVSVVDSPAGREVIEQTLTEAKEVVQEAFTEALTDVVQEVSAPEASARETPTSELPYRELPQLDYIGISPPAGEPRRLDDLLRSLRWNTDWSDLYVAGEFDCSEMAGLLENYLESKGFDTYILVAELGDRDWYSGLSISLERLIGLREGDKAYHAWVAVNIDDEYMAVESTRVYDSNYYGDFKYQRIYSTAAEAERAYPGEFDYWNSPQYGTLYGQLP